MAARGSVRLPAVSGDEILVRVALDVSGGMKEMSELKAGSSATGSATRVSLIGPARLIAWVQNCSLLVSTSDKLLVHLLNVINKPIDKHCPSQFLHFLSRSEFSQLLFKFFERVHE